MSAGGWATAGSDMRGLFLDGGGSFDLLAQGLAGQPGDVGGHEDGGGEADAEEDPELGPPLGLLAAGQRREAPERLAVVDVEQGARQHRHGSGEVLQERHLGQAQGVVEQVEWEDRGEPQQGHDLEALAADRPVDGGEPGVALDAPLDAAAGDVARHQEGQRGTEGRTDEGVDRALRQPEDDARGEREQRARDEGHGGDGVAEDEDDRSPDAEAVDPLRELKDVAAGLTAEEEQGGQDRYADQDVEDVPALGRGFLLRDGLDGAVHGMGLLSDQDYGPAGPDGSPRAGGPSLLRCRRAARGYAAAQRAAASSTPLMPRNIASSEAALP